MFRETLTSRFPAHPRYEGEPDTETAVRLYINGDSRVDLELETVRFDGGETRSFETRTFTTLEDALEFLGTESDIPDATYSLVMDDIRRMRG